MTTFSVIIPVYKVEQYIEQCIKSLLYQTFKDFELIFVDDNSPDNSIEIIEKYKNNDSRIKLLRQELSQGTGAARNLAMTIAEGKYICFVDSDDWVSENFLEKIFNEFEQKTDLKSVIFKPWVYIEKSDFATIDYRYPYLAHHLSGFININYKNISLYPIYCWCRAYRTDFLKENNIKFAESGFEEFKFIYSLYALSPETYLINDMIYYYRKRTSSWTSSRRVKSLINKVAGCTSAAEELYRYLEDKNLNRIWKNAIVNFVKNELFSSNQFEDIKDFAEEKFNELEKNIN